ncbi:MAG: mannose-1-phosphate guanylyltransferase, partial [Gammaproteobacteria bacterium]|nr:mannose-1-phosphate guanylyltransferase [Gammaproteobacteria bacterium]
MKNQPTPIKAVILAGGSGTRLWPLSRMQLPKQFLRLQGDKTLLDATVHRLEPLIAKEDVLIVTGVEHAKGEAYNSLQHYQTLLEPVGRNTAPAIVLAAAWLLHQSRQSQQGDQAEDPIMIVLPADHIIKEREAFQTALKQAIEAAKQGGLVTFGIKPTRPDSGFGYIQVDGQFADHQSPLNVIKFTEKPDQTTAQQYLKKGDYLWNSGMFVWRATTILEEIKTHLPEVYEITHKIEQQWTQGVAPQTAVDENFPAMPNISIDYGVLEKSSKVSLIPCDIGWSDVGSWDAVH